MMATASDMVCDLRRDHRRPPAEPLDVDAVGDLEDVRHVVADQDDRQAPVADVADQLQHPVALLDAQRGRRLVEDDDLAAERRRARHRDGLALPAGQALHGLADVLQRADAQLAHVPRGLGLHVLACRASGTPSRGRRACAPRGRGTGCRRCPGPGATARVWYTVSMPAGRASIGLLKCTGLAVEPDLALVRDQRAAQGLDQAGLARAVVADDREDLAGVELEVAAGDRGDLAVALDQALGLQHRLAGGLPRVCSLSNEGLLMPSPSGSTGRGRRR